MQPLLLLLLATSVAQQAALSNRAHYYDDVYWQLDSVDVDGDGVEDLVGLVLDGDEIHVRHGIPQGWNDDPLRVATPQDTTAFRVADMNGDGAVDLVVEAGRDFWHSEPVLGVLLADGLGGYQPLISVALDDINRGVFEVADVDGNGTLDVILQIRRFFASTALTVLVGDGAGGFRDSFELFLGNQPSSVLVGQVDTSTALELVVVRRAWTSQSAPQQLDLLRFSPVQGFSSFGTVTVPAGRPLVQLADVDEDGLDDLVVAGDHFGPYTLWLRSALGDGTFAPEIEVPIDVSAGEIRDIDGDGHVDIVSAVAVVRGDGALGFSPPSVLRVELHGSFRRLLTRDMDDDGRRDVVQWTDQDLQRTFLFEYRLLPDGSYEGDGTLLESPSPIVSTVADMDGDGLDDLIRSAGDALAATAYYTFANSDEAGGFDPRYGVTYTSDCNPVGGSVPLVGDYDGDGRSDFLVVDHCRTTLYLQSQPRVFSTGVDVGAAASPSGPVGDIDGDGRDDLVALDRVLFGAPTGLVPGPLLPLPPSGAKVLGDVDGNGLLDVVASRGKAIEVWLAQPDRTFVGPVTTDLPVDLVDLQATADFDGNGHDDVVLTHAFGFNSAVLRGHADGTLGALEPFGFPRVKMLGLRVGDVNGDGVQDIFGGGDQLLVATGQGDGAFVTRLYGLRPHGGFGSQPMTLATFRPGERKLVYSYEAYVKEIPDKLIR